MADPTLCDSSEMQALLRSHHDLLNTLHKESGLTAAGFDALFGEQLRVLSGYVGLLPASQYGLFHERGGLITLCLKLAARVYRSVDGELLSPQTATEIRRQSEEAWRYAALLAGLLRPLPSIHGLRVQARSGQWTLFQGPLCDLAADELLDAKVVWPLEREHGIGPAGLLWYASRIITPRSTAYMLGRDRGAFDALINCLGGDEEGVLWARVHEAQRLVTEAYLDGRAHTRVSGVPVELQIMDAVRQLIGTQWAVNIPNGKLWYTREGVFLSWEAAAADVALLLRAEGMVGVPRTADTLAWILADGGFLELEPVTQLPYHHLRLEVANKAIRERMVKLTSKATCGLNFDPDDAIESMTLKSGAIAPEPAAAKAQAKSDAQIELDLADAMTATPALRNPRKKTATAKAASAPERPEPSAPSESAPGESDEPPPLGEQRPLRPKEGLRSADATTCAGEERLSLDYLRRYGAVGDVLERLILATRAGDLAPMRHDDGIALNYPLDIKAHLDGSFASPNEFIEQAGTRNVLVPVKGQPMKMIHREPEGARVVIRAKIWEPARPGTRQSEESAC